MEEVCSYFGSWVNVCVCVLVMVPLDAPECMSTCVSDACSHTYNTHTSADLSVLNTVSPLCFPLLSCTNLPWSSQLLSPPLLVSLLFTPVLSVHRNPLFPSFRQQTSLICSELSQRLQTNSLEMPNNNISSSRYSHQKQNKLIHAFQQETLSLMLK